MRRTARPHVALGALLLLGWAGTAAAQPRPAADVARFTDAHRRSEALRAGLVARARDVRLATAGGGPWPAELAGRLRADRVEYAALRATLFELALGHAAAVVERLPGRDPRATLLRTSLALAAGTALVRNFHAAAAVVAEEPGLRAAWDEADPAAGVPGGMWTEALGAYRSVEYQTLFSAAIDRLGRHRHDLDGFLARADGPFVALYPGGVEPALREARDALALLRAGLAEEDLGEDARQLSHLVARSRLLRAEWAAAGPAIREAVARDGGLIRGSVHRRLQTIKRDYLDVRGDLYRLGHRHLPKLTRQDLPYPPAFRLRAIAISLLAGVTLYENARELERSIVPIRGVRPLLNQADPALGVPRNFWDEVEREFYRIEYRNFLDAGARLLEAAQPPPYDPDAEDDPLLTWISRELAATAATAEIRGEGPPRQIARILRHYAQQITAVGLFLPKTAKLQSSKGFGNLVGVVEFRKGKLWAQPRWVDFVRDRIRPGDLLLEKTPFRLTDTFIPGHFGHVALYVGTERQVADLGLLRHPFVAPYRAQLAQGRTIVEALRDGTQINTIEHFLNVDDVAILRPKRDRIPPGDVLEAVKLAFSHVGKKYDFGFDSNTWDTIVCSELAFQTYVNVEWSASRVMTSYTISPDDVAVLAGPEAWRSFELVAFVHDGRVVHDPAAGVQGEALYAKLLGRRYAEVGSRAGAALPPPPRGSALDPR
jgi:hypothetical protein